MQTHNRNQAADPQVAGDAAAAAVEELNRIVSQAEGLLESLSDGGGEAVEGIRRRVGRVIGEARSRIAGSGQQLRAQAGDAARRTQELVEDNPWKAVAIAAGVGAAVALLVSSQVRRS